MTIEQKTPAEEGRGRLARPRVGERQDGATRETGAGLPVQTDPPEEALAAFPEGAILQSDSPGG